MGAGVVEEHGWIGYRRRLIEEIRGRGIHDLAILRLFDQVPRHLFIPEGYRARAYDDAPVPIGFGQTCSQPSLQALYLQILQPAKEDRVLEIGTGSGFLTALLALMADRVYSVERIRELARRAREVLDTFRLTNVAILVGDGTIGWRKFAPYQVVTVSAASPSIPPALVDQLADPGRMLIPVGDRHIQDLILVRKSNKTVSEELACPSCAFVPLLGRYGWSEEKGTEE